MYNFWICFLILMMQNGWFMLQIHHSFSNSMIESSDEASYSSAGDHSDEDSDSSAGKSQ